MARTAKIPSAFSIVLLLITVCVEFVASIDAKEEMCKCAA